MRAALISAVLALGVAGCGPRPGERAARAGGDEVTLYRDRAVIRQRVEVDVAAGATTTVQVRVAAGTAVDDLVVLDRGALTITEVRGPPGADRRPRSVFAGGEDDDDDDDDDVDADDADDAVDADAAAAEDHEDEPDERDEPAGAGSPGGAGAPRDPVTPGANAPSEITFVVRAARRGRHALHLAYVTDRLSWDAAYTMMTTPARTHATLRGALEITNTSGVTFARTRAYVVDAELGAWRGRIAEQLGSALTGRTRSGSPAAVPRSLGTITLAPGETRLELLPNDPRRSLRSVLVYDPIGTKHDHAGAAPIRDPSLGTERAGSRVTESFEIARPEASSAGLPGGPVRMLERRPDGAIRELGEARLFDAATRIADEDTVAIGTADGVTGRRERREITLDEDGKRLVEEFVLTITNTRAHPVEVVLREHLYRGQNWTLAYQTAADPRKEGPQQISLRTTVPARGEAKVLYVVVYTWP